MSTTTQPTDSSSHTNTGAIAGGVVGGVAGAAIIIGLAWFCIRRSRQPHRPPSEPVVHMAASGDHHPVPIAELEGNRVAELPGEKNPVAELPESQR